MKRITLIVFTALAWVFHLKSQDTLYTNDGRILTGKILESYESTLKLRPDSTNYDFDLIISKYLLDSILYSNGEVKSYLFLDRSIIPEVSKDGELFIGFDFLSLLSGNTRFSLEYRLKPGGTGIFVPVTVNIDRRYDLDDNPPYWFSENSIGLGVKLNTPSRLNAVSYSFSLALVGGNYYYSYYNYQIDEEVDETDSFIELDISNSIQVKLINNLYLGFSMDNVLISFFRINSGSDIFSNKYRKPSLYPILHLELKVKL